MRIRWDNVQKPLAEALALSVDVISRHSWTKAVRQGVAQCLGALSQLGAAAEQAQQARGIKRLWWGVGFKGHQCLFEELGVYSVDKEIPLNVYGLQFLLFLLNQQ